MNYTKRILVIRLSALGDVAILQPVLQQRAAANPDVLFLMAAPKLLQPLFEGMENVEFVPTAKRQPVRQLYGQLAALHPDMVADMHHINRTIGADWLFRLHGVPVRHIHKHNAVGKPSWQRYDEVFDRCRLRKPSESLVSIAGEYWATRPSHEGLLRVGVAPFAQHEGKIWSQNHLLELLASLSLSGRYEILLFGSKEEARQLDAWAARFSGVRSVAGRQSFAEELRLIGSLDLMVSMDSANMHFASCLGVPVVSVWGATHPCRGFYGWRQNPAWAVQSDLPCRPCSKYGNKHCKYGDYRCMQLVTAAMVMEKIEAVIG